MKMDEKCIVFRWKIKENSGGPSGYLRNLQNGLNLINSNYKILSDFSPGKKIISKSKNNIREKRNIRFFLEDIKLSLYFLKPVKWVNHNDEIKQYKLIHFHSLEDLYDYRRLKKNKKFILTPHRPEPMYIEKINEINNENNTNYSYPFLKIILKRIEKKAYKSCDGFIFPSYEAMEIYYSFPGFKKYSNKKNIKYLITGCEKKNGNEKYRNDQNKIIVSFIGRHTEVKGYDFLKNFFENNIKFIKENNIYFYCAGKILGVYPKNDHWIELGLISDPENLIESSDYVILPNLNTYFDLIALEVLSQGKILIASNTGGNISLNKYTSGVKLFESGNEDSLKNVLERLIHKDNGEKKYLSKQNMDFYNEYCSLENFAKNYIKILESIDIYLE